MNQYMKLNNDEMNNHLSNYIVDHLSYSSIRSFQRNELAYEIRYIFNIYGAMGVSAIAGSAYHHALNVYFGKIKSKEKVPSYDELIATGYEYIESKGIEEIKLGKTDNDDDKEKEFLNQKIKIKKKFESLMENFLFEVDIYLDDISEVLFLEERLETFINISGWDCPLPFKFVADLIYRNKQGKIVIVDHKSKASYTKEENAVYTLSQQAIIYIKGIETLFNTDERMSEFKGEKVSEFLFIENKASKNRDKSKQLRKISMPIDSDEFKNSELLLAMMTKKLCDVSQDPDYNYMPNLDDNFEDPRELLDFWNKKEMGFFDDLDLKKERDELKDKKEVEKCLYLLENNESAEKESLVNMILKLGTADDCTKALRYCKEVKFELNNKLAWRVAEDGNAGNCYIALAYGRGLEAVLINKLALIVAEDEKSYYCNSILNYEDILEPDTVKKLKAK